MWFAALGSYQNEPWLVHLAYKLLHGVPTTEGGPEEGAFDGAAGAVAGGDAVASGGGGGCLSVLDLLDVSAYPFNASTGPPLRVRAALYHYDFTRLDTSWNRRNLGATAFLGMSWNAPVPLLPSS